MMTTNERNAPTLVVAAPAICQTWRRPPRQTRDRQHRQAMCDNYRRVHTVPPCQILAASLYASNPPVIAAPTARNTKILQCVGSLVKEDAQKHNRPQCGSTAVDEKPANVFFCEPNTWILHEGIFARLLRPPALPMSIAAQPAPTNADKFGAMNDMRCSTKWNSFDFA